MKIQWLEKMAEEDQVSKEALDIIYHDCEEIIKNAGMQKEAMHPAMGMILGGALGTIGMGSVMLAGSKLSDVADRALLNAKAQATKDKIVNNVNFDPKQKEKAEARFNEIAKFAPSLAANEPVMTHLVHKKMNTGLTDRDVQNLIAIQSNFTNDPLEYASMSKTSEELCGENLADRVINLSEGLEKQAGIGSVLGAIKPEVKDLLLKAVAPMLLVSAGISGAAWAKNKIDEVRLNAQLKNTFKGIMDNSHDTILAEYPQKSKDAFNTLAHFAPHVAIEPNAASAFMKKLVSYETGPNASDIRDITEIEKNFKAGPSPQTFEGLKLVGMPYVAGKFFEHQAKIPNTSAQAANLRATGP